MMKTLIYFRETPKFHLSNLYPIYGPEFFLTQVLLVCPWVLHNGQITVLVFCTFGTTIIV